MGNPQGLVIGPFTLVLYFWVRTFKILQILTYVCVTRIECFINKRNLYYWLSEEMVLATLLFKSSYF